MRDAGEPNGFARAREDLLAGLPRLVSRVNETCHLALEEVPKGSGREGSVGRILLQPLAAWMGWSTW